MNEHRLISGGARRAGKSKQLERSALRYEQLVHWATQEWQQRYANQPYITLAASSDCSSELARNRLKNGRKLKGRSRYLGHQAVDCPYAVPLTSFYTPGRSVVLTNSVGAFIFSFEHEGEKFDALYASAYYSDDSLYCNVSSIVLVPPKHLVAWAAFEEQCGRAVNHLERSQNVYIIGGRHASFKPTVNWDDVILSESLKNDVRTDIETFFADGVKIYQQLNLPPFRKLLLVGPPGTGKSTLCAALAKLAIQQKRIVVYVSASDEDGATFDKIHRALDILADSRHPVLLIVEELDAYLIKEDKSQILNVLDGLESPNNPRGAVLIATTNYPEVIDERIAKRPGRVDRIIYIPAIQDEDQARQMLLHYMGPQWQPDHERVIPKLIGQTGAFVREVAVYARLLAAYKRETTVSCEMLEQSVKRLSSQLATDDDLQPHRPIGFGQNGGNGHKEPSTHPTAPRSHRFSGGT